MVPSCWTDSEVRPFFFLVTQVHGVSVQSDGDRTAPVDFPNGPGGGVRSLRHTICSSLHVLDSNALYRREDGLTPSYTAFTHLPARAKVGMSIGPAEVEASDACGCPRALHTVKICTLAVIFGRGGIYPLIHLLIH